MTINANGKREAGLQEANGRLQNGDRIMGDGTSNYRGDGSRINRTEYMKDEFEEVMGGQQQRRSQGSVARWETFLHIRSVKVLLVENDDSTRHVVAALLRNLNYEVILAANGLQAWRILEDLTTHIDIVLTEVVMPCLSGIGLLCKIMSHKTRKNIPVIMMSSHDSMGLVFKCLSKGAVDFLGKPIRKNELKNLWQHVWRRCHSSSGSGSESGTHTQKSVKSKSGVKFENNSSSKEMDDDESTGLKTGDGIDDDSDSQSSWAKEVDSSQAMSARDQIAKCSDSTCAQLCSNSESTKKIVPVTTLKEFQEHGEQVGNVGSEKYLAIGKRKNLDPQLDSPNKVAFKLSNTNRIPRSKPVPYPNKTRKGIDPPSHSNHPCNKNKGIIGITPSRQAACEEHARILENKDKTLDGSKVEPEVELSLKKLRVNKDTGKAAQTDCNVLRRPDFSAFSRSKWYGTTSNGVKAPNGITLSGSLADGCPETVKDESGIQYCSNGNLLYPSSDGGNNNVDIGSITDKLSINATIVSKEKLDTTSDKLEATSTVNDLNLLSVFTPMKMDLNFPPQQVLLVKTDDLASPAMLAPIRGSLPELPVQHIHHHHHVHHFHGVDSEQPLSDLDDLSLKKLTEDSSHFRSLNVFVGSVEANTGNCSFNKSASGSKHESNGQNGSSTIVHAGGTNVESDVHVAGKSGSSNASGSGNRIDQNKSAHREAALTKFRQKKERQFGNKIRCQNKKRLAE